MIEEQRFLDRWNEDNLFQLVSKKQRASNINCKLVDLDMIAYFFFDQVRNLQYNVRHQLADRFRGGHALLGSGTSKMKSWMPMTGSKLSEEGLACLLFSMYLKFLDEHRYSYQSGAMGYLFSSGADNAWIHWQLGYGAFFRRVGVKYALNPIRDERNDGALCLECSSLTNGFLSLLWAFGFQQNQLFTSCISHQHLVNNKPYSAIQKANIAGVDGANILTNKNTEKFTSPEYEFIDTLPEIRKLVADVGDKEPLPTQVQGFRNIIMDNLSNCLWLGPNGSMRMLRRDVFSNHFCAKVVGENGEFRFPYFDPLTRMRYKHGLSDVFEEYKKSNRVLNDRDHQETLDEYLHDPSVEMASSKRRMYTIPTCCDENLKKSQFEYSPLGDVRFDYQGHGEKFENLTIYELARVKKAVLYAVLDEHDWRDQDALTKLPRRLRFLMATPSITEIIKDPELNPAKIMESRIQSKVKSGSPFRSKLGGTGKK